MSSSSNVNSVTVKADSQNTTAIKYNPSGDADWYFTYEGGNSGIYEQTLTTAVSPGPSATFEFVGTRVQVFGSVGAGVSDHGPPVSIYSIDGDTPISYLAQNLSSQADGVQFFDSGTLDNGTHLLVFNVTQVINTNQYMLDYIQYTTLVPASSSSSSSSAPSSSSTPSSATGSATSAGTTGQVTASTGSQSSTQTNTPPSSHRASVGPIVGGVVGGVAGLAIILAALFFWWRRRNVGPPESFYYSTPVYPYNPDEGNDGGAPAGANIAARPYGGVRPDMAEASTSYLAGGSSSHALQASTALDSSSVSGFSDIPGMSMSTPGVTITPLVAPSSSSDAAASGARLGPSLSVHKPPLAPNRVAAVAPVPALEPVRTPPPSDSGFSDNDAKTDAPPMGVPALPSEPHVDSGIRFGPRVAPSEAGLVDAPPMYTAD